MPLISELVAEFEVGIDQAKQRLSRVQTAQRGRHLTADDEQMMHEATFISAFACLEKFVADLFWVMVTSQDNHPMGIIPVFTFPTRDVAEGVCFQDGYPKWFPLDTPAKWAKHFFVGGKQPFDLVTDTAKAELTICLAIRNYIVHQSATARTHFDQKVARLDRLPADKQSPGGYLSMPKSTGLTYCEYHIGELVRVGRKLAGAP